jgi:hypothetical protein
MFSKRKKALFIPLSGRSPVTILKFLFLLELQQPRAPKGDSFVLPGPPIFKGNEGKENPRGQGRPFLKTEMYLV